MGRSVRRTAIRDIVEDGELADRGAWDLLDTPEQRRLNRELGIHRLNYLNNKNRTNDKRRFRNRDGSTD